MAKPQEALAEQFSNLHQQREAATLGMWTFLATEVLFFGGMFLSYIVYRHSYPQAFAIASRETLLLYGTINTAVLLTSSLSMVLSIQFIKGGKSRPSFAWLLVTILLGLVFLGFKGMEYAEDVRQNLLPGHHFKAGLPAEAQIFWVLYWLMTGLHGLHVAIGVALLSWMAWKLQAGRFSPLYHTPLEMTGLYWHFVDVVWIFLYPLLYLIHRFE